jgi:formylmethanofuran dehydrogenase subunit B
MPNKIRLKIFHSMESTWASGMFTVDIESKRGVKAAQIISIESEDIGPTREELQEKFSAIEKWADVLIDDKTPCSKGSPLQECESCMASIEMAKSIKRMINDA